MLWIISVLLIIASIAIGVNYFTNPFAQFIAAAGSLEAMGIAFFIISKVIFWFGEKVFFFFIDVVPADGRSKEDALNVLRTGQNFIFLKKMLTPAEWSYEDTDEYINTVPLINRILFGDKIRENVNETIRKASDYIEDNNLSDLKEYEGVFAKIVNDVVSKQSIIFRLWMNPFWFSIIFIYMILILLFIIYRLSVMS